MIETPIMWQRFSEGKDELTKLQERWTSLIRHQASEMIKREGANKMVQPDLFQIANEIDAFFVALKSK